MANPNNNGTLVGRVAQDIKEFPNADGSKKLLVTLAVEDNYVSGKDRKVQTNFPTLHVFLGANVQGRGSWDLVGKGDLISVSTRLSAKPYMKDGQMVYPDAITEVDGFPQFLESKAITDARRARHAVEGTSEAPAAETPEQTIARLEAEVAAARETSPFAGAAV